MKYFRRYLSVLLCFLLLSSVFCLSVNAAEKVDSSKLKVNIYAYDDISGKTFGQLDLTNGEIGGKSSNYNFPNGTNNVGMVYRFTFVNTDSTPIFKKGKTYSFKFSNLNIYNSSSDLAISNPFYVWNARFIDVNSNSSSNQKTFYNLHFDTTKDLVSFEFENYTPEVDVYRFTVYLRQDYTGDGTGNPYISTNYVTDGISFNIEQQSEEAGLLSGIVGWVTNIFNKISEGFSNMTQGFLDIVNGLMELPSKLWTLISEGLKELFVPDENFIVQFKEDFDMLMGQRFGALYEVGELTVSFFERILVFNGESQGSVDLPVVNVKFGSENFSFGGYTVDFIPEQLNHFYTILRTVTSICVTFLFINGLRKRYDEVMGVES